jgi:thioredoxin reductase (NADPH)
VYTFLRIKGSEKYMEKHKLVIIGSGPAGYTAAIYAARANLNPVVFEGEGGESGPIGGQLMTTTEVENYPGFPEGILGPKLMIHCKKQAERFGAKMLMEDVQEVNLHTHPYQIRGSKTTLSTEAVIIATGASAKRLDVPGAEEGAFWQKGVTACAVCDGASPLFRNRPLFVIGGGDSAVEEAIFLTKFGSRVFIVHRRNALRASKILADRAMRHSKVEILWDHILERIEGDSCVRSVLLKNLNSGEVYKREAGGVFFAIGHDPNTSFLKNQLPLNEKGYIQVTPGTTQTGIPGVFACGDVQDPIYKQAVTAAGTGCMAALEAEKWLSQREEVY